MLNLYKVSYYVAYKEKPLVVKFIKAKRRIDAIEICVPKNEIGNECNFTDVNIELLCQVDEIIQCSK